jgi:hypothetical protein
VHGSVAAYIRVFYAARKIYIASSYSNMSFACGIPHKHNEFPFWHENGSSDVDALDVGTLSEVNIMLSGSFPS